MIKNKEVDIKGILSPNKNSPNLNPYLSKVI